MTSHIFHLERSYFNGRIEDWESDWRIIVFNGINLHEYKADFSAQEERVKAEFPDHIWYDYSLSIHRGQMKWRNEFKALQKDQPDLWHMITFHFQLQEGSK